MMMMKVEQCRVLCLNIVESAFVFASGSSYTQFKIAKTHSIARALHWLWRRVIAYKIRREGQFVYKRPFAIFLWRTFFVADVPLLLVFFHSVSSWYGTRNRQQRWRQSFWSIFGQYDVNTSLRHAFIYKSSGSGVLEAGTVSCSYQAWLGLDLS